ncbi:TPA: hypothetical protein DEP21_02855 [Patescibacteria group bacterium]|nr:hypothetical protein [Candidatus Gracilibacteria bacterium]
MTYTNLGSTSISNFRVIDIWPQSLDYVSSNYAPISRTDTSLVWSFSGPLQPGQKQIITVIGRVKSNIR